ncbi:glycoside hydrolase family 19 protein [Chitinivibrio alkaliphilus]|uniref:Chitinase, GH19 family n=1 Tax=Chitinivibrio alkaliphilus ACht1 TaxID=1313304 RepID=U7DCE2_9BACT|nr:glycoside hydrolase family 19 protein [Chitinivibrio alkaliphilus]ERP39243.1 Chitinase, GH19 family [Chitinivibrio alkaliphilus ACht1]
MKFLVLLLLHFLFCSVSAVQDTLFQEVHFDVNTAATITLAAEALIEGHCDQVIEVDTDGTEAVTASLPIRISDKVSLVTESERSADAPYLENSAREARLIAGNSFARGSAALYSLQGRRMAETALDRNGVTELPLSSLSHGIYFLRLTGQNEQKTIRLIHQSGGPVFADGRSSQRPPNAPTRSARICNAEHAVYSISVAPQDTDYVPLEGILLTLDEDGIVGTDGDLVISDDTISISLENTGVVERFQELLDEETYEELFPNRYGFGRGNSPWDGDDAAKIESDGDFDFYTYESLLNAVRELADIRIEVWLREGVNYAQKIKWFNEATGESREMITHPDYNAEWNISKEEILSSSFSYADFCNVGDFETRQRELAAFLANISHETTGQGSDFYPKTWGLYWIEEARWQKGSTDLDYRDEGHAVYPPSAGKSYHGRGPIQISWNYNYGQVSEFLYGDKQILLDNPHWVIENDHTGDGQPDATLAFKTAIWFWMYPQAPKPSCHAVMTGLWEPTEEDIAARRHESKFGMTANIINGGLECGNGDGDYRVTNRAGYYKRYAEIMDILIEDYLDCGNMGYY